MNALASGPKNSAAEPSPLSGCQATEDAALRQASRETETMRADLTLALRFFTDLILRGQLSNIAGMKLMVRYESDHSSRELNRRTVNSQPAVSSYDLTAREREVLTLIASGESSKKIASKLGMAFGTAVCHRYRIQQKLHASNTADMTRAAIRMGLVEP